MKGSTLREGTAMASPLPQDMEEELAPVGSEPGTNGCWVQGGAVGWEEGRGWGGGCTPLPSRQVAGVTVEVRGSESEMSAHGPWHLVGVR
jgi:hypothetical protein